MSVMSVSEFGGPLATASSAMAALVGVSHGTPDASTWPEAGQFAKTKVGR